MLLIFFFLWVIETERSEALSCLIDSYQPLALCLDPLSKETVVQTLMVGQIVNLTCWSL